MWVCWLEIPSTKLPQETASTREGQQRNPPDHTYPAGWRCNTADCQERFISTVVLCPRAKLENQLNGQKMELECGPVG